MIREPAFLHNGHQHGWMLSLNHQILAAALELTWILTSKPAHADANLGDRIQFDWYDQFVWLTGNDGCQVVIKVIYYFC